MTNDILAWATVVLAALTIVLAYANIRQSILARETLQDSELSRDEFVKSRIDDRAPLVSVVEVARGRPTVWSDPDSRLMGTIIEVEPLRCLNGSEGDVNVAAWFWIENQGRTTAHIRLPATSAIAAIEKPTLHMKPAHKEQLVLADYDLAVFRDVMPPPLALGPRCGCLLYMFRGRPFDDWIQNRSSSEVVTIRSHDMMTEGVSDSMDVTFSGSPLVPAPGTTEWFATIPPNDYSVIIGETQRTYRLQKTFLEPSMSRRARLARWFFVVPSPKRPDRDP